MKRQECRGAEDDGERSNSARSDEQRLESAEHPIAHRQLGRSAARASQDDQLLLEQEIFCDDRSHAAGATQPRGHDGQVQQREQQIPMRAIA
jgi:hypothetical protein